MTFRVDRMVRAKSKTPRHRRSLRDSRTHVLIVSQTKNQQLPWGGCRVSLGIEHETRVWRLSDERSRLPHGCNLEATDGSGARSVAIFRISTVPTATDGKKVLSALRELGVL